MKATHVIITGRVQGVGFRDWLVAQAHKLGIAGWVRNVGDDGVEALLAGDPGAVEECLHACRRGPPYASIDTITDRIAEPPADPGFVKRPSLATRP